MAELTDEDSLPVDESHESGEVPTDQAQSPAGETDASEDNGSTATPPVTPPKQPVNPELGRRLQRVRKVPVNVIVRIAERKMTLQQLRSITPGTILMFDKPCDSLLDVFVDNRLYCRGEAVKVDETFGIRINECLSQVVREKKVHQV